MIKKLYGDFYEIRVAGEAHAKFLPLKRDELITAFIRKRYTMDDEIALLANASDTERHAEEYAEYQSYRKSIKEGLAEIWEEVEAVNKAWEDSIPVDEE